MKSNQSRTGEIWIYVSAAVYFAGTVAAFLILPSPEKSNAAELYAYLSRFAIAGTLFAGLGQVLRAAAHNTKSGRWKVVDGVGKVVGVFGWSLGLPTVVTLAVANGADEWMMNVALALTFIAPAVLTICGFITGRMRKHGN